MRIRFNASEAARLTLFGLVSAIPALFQPELFPYWIMPASAIAGILSADAARRANLRAFPSVALFSLLAFATLKGLRLAAGLSSNADFTGWYARISLTSLPLFAVSSAAFLSTLFYRRGATWRRIEPLVLLALFAAGFWTQGDYRLTVFDHPTKATAYALAVFIVAVLSLALSFPPRSRRLAGIAIFLPLFALGGFLSIRTFNAESVSANGGLIQPTLFRFDFSPYLTLQSEISLNDRLVLIAHVPEEYSSTLLRRMCLSGWDPGKGFFEKDAPNEGPQPLSVPDAPASFYDPGYRLRSTVRQEYFIVNFDPRSLIAMDYPVAVDPYRLWQTETFNGAFAVTSRVTGFFPFELYDSPAPDPADDPRLSREDLSFYTEIDPETADYVRPLAEALTDGIQGYYEKVLALTLWLLGDSFRYSLHPGTAPDGNQLKYFLTDTHKGYCTYYAFALALMCRSLDVPARVAAGFFIAPDSGALDYYPVRSNMAHAWVEVYFPGYGWVSFDPTNQTPAEGENLQFDGSPRNEEFMSLLNEIIDRKGELSTLTGEKNENETGERGFLGRVSAFFRATGPRTFLLLLILPLVPIAMKTYARLALRYSRNPRKVILLAERYGAKAAKKRTLTSGQKNGIAELARLANKARFAPECTAADRERAKEILRSLKLRQRGPEARTIALILASLLLASQGRLSAQSAPAQSEAEMKGEATLLLERATRAIAAENWESATALLLEGKNRFPQNAEFPYTLGVLFLDQSLYPSAVRELSYALDLGFPDPEIYLKLSDATGYENRDEESLLWLRRYIAQNPDNLTAWSSFGWLCYKTHRFSEGIESLNKVIAAWGPDGNIFVGLGNLYSAIYDYDNAKNAYTSAIELANGKKQQYLASVYLYNRSILEESFYRFEDSYRDAKFSLDAAPRASGYLMQAELEMRKLSYADALERYIKAQALDSTPLATIGLAETYLEAGYPEQAYAQIRSVNAKTDRSWIANYGTTTQQFASDMHNLERDYWRFMLNRERKKVVHNFSTWLKRTLTVIRCSVLGWLHDAKYRLYTLEVAKTYHVKDREHAEGNGQDLYEHSFEYLALDRWAEIAKPHLTEADRIETTHIEMSRPSYEYEWGAINNDISRLDEAILTLDPLWERKILAEALSKRLKLTRRNDVHEIVTLSSRLFELDPARFIRDDLSLPVRISIDSSVNPRFGRNIERALKHVGFYNFQYSPLSLNIDVIPDGIRISLVNSNGKPTGIPQIIHNSEPNPQVIANSVNSFSTDLFRSKLTK